MDVDFWEEAAAQRLTIGFCERCQRYVHPSVVRCAECGGDVMSRTVSGRGQVVAATVNHQAWTADLRTPYVVAIVSLEESPVVRLTTNVVGCEPEDVSVGLQVEVVFEERAGATVPVFTPSPQVAVTPARLELPRVSRVSAPARKMEDDVAITGIGASEVGRRLPRSARGLTVDACLAALEDAGLRPSDIDGVCAYPGPAGSPGMSRGGARAVMQDLGIRPTWHAGGAETPGQTGTIIAAITAIAAGLCDHVLCVSSTSSRTPPSAEATGRGGGPLGEDDELQWRLPFGAYSPANWIALAASQHMHRFGTARTSLGCVAISARRHAGRNPEAVFRTPLTMDDYLGARAISTPFGLYDCDVPCDGAYAVIVSRRSLAADLRQSPVLVEAVGTRITEDQSWDQGTLTHQPNVFGPAAHLWSRTDLRPSDVGVAELYDGFTFNCMTWLEALGFCGMGESGDFVEGGHRIDLGGELPLNTHGGQLSAGRSNGYGALKEAVHQIRGTAGERQVEGVEVAVTSSGGGIPASCMLLTTS